MSSSSGNRSGPAISTMPFTGAPTETRPSAPATSSAAMGWMSAGGSRTALPSVASRRCGPRNSKNCVARTIEYGIEDSLISFSCASFARK